MEEAHKERKYMDQKKREGPTCIVGCTPPEPLTAVWFPIPKEFKTAPMT